MRSLRRTVFRVHPVRVLRLAAIALVILLLLIPIMQEFKSEPVEFVSEDQQILNYLSKNLDVHYRLLSNRRDNFHVDLTFTNQGEGTITTGAWAIYFHHMHYINTDAFNHVHSPIFTMDHVNSYLFRIQPTRSFPNLTADEYVTVRMSGGGWVVSRSDVMPNWYVSIDSSNSSHPRYIMSTVSENVSFVGPFDEAVKWKRHPGDLYEPFSPEERFVKNHIPPTETLPTLPRLLLPAPFSMEQQSDTMTIDSHWRIFYSSDSLNEGEFLSSTLNLKAEESTAGGVCDHSILLRIDNSIAENPHSDSTYELYVDSQNSCVTIIGSASAGVFYGCQSLLQLLSSPSLPAVLPSVRILDHPRFPYRGLMVDVSRNFFGLHDIMSVMDGMSTYKLNVLHLHLADDEGWRLEIPGLPELTDVGGQRCHDLQERSCIMPMHGSGPFNNTSGSGYFTVEDYNIILTYANSKHITVLPEFDMPGHSHAAIHSMKSRYLKFAESGHVDEGLRFLLSDLKDNSYYRSGQFFKDSAINPCLESTYRFIEFVMSAVIHMHKDVQPLKRYHFGGDEVPESAYGGSLACSEFRKANSQIRSSKQLKNYFIGRVAQIASALNIGLQGWEDAYSRPTGGHMSVEPMKLPEVVSNAWYHVWGGNMEANVYNMANAGYKIVLSSTSHLYFDNPQEPDPEDWGLHWATRYVDTKRTFAYRPDSFYDNIDFGFWGDRMSKQSVCVNQNACPALQRKENILGMSGVVWSEEIRTKQRLDQMLWPRLLAVAERAWHRANWESMDGLEIKLEKEKDWRQFATVVGHKEIPRLERLGISPYLPPPGVTFQSEQVKVNSMFPGLRIQCSKDKITWHDFKTGMKLSGRSYFSTVSPSGNLRSRPVTYSVPTD